MNQIRSFLAIVSLAAATVQFAPAQPVVFTVLNAASSNAFVSPGCWISVYGANLATTTQTANGALTPTLGGMSVTVAGLPALLQYVSPVQVNALIPFEVAIPANTVVPLVVTSAAGGGTYNIRLTREAPAIFRVFDSNFKGVLTIHPNDVLVLYAAGLGPVDSSGRVVDPVDVYLGERKAQVLYAGSAPGFPGVYQLNVIAPRMATDRVFLHSGGYQSNIAYVSIPAGANTKNSSGHIDGLLPSNDPNYPRTHCNQLVDTSPCVTDDFSVMLHAGVFSVGLDILPGAAPFDIAAVGEGGGVIISIDPAAGAYTASVATLTDSAKKGNVQDSSVTLWNYQDCNLITAVCPPYPFPNGIFPYQTPPWWLRAIQSLPAANTPGAGPNAFMQTSGTLTGSRFAVDSQNNSALSIFGGIVQLPYGPFESLGSTFTLYVDGVALATTSIRYFPPYRCLTAGQLWQFCLGTPGPTTLSPQFNPQF